PLARLAEDGLAVEQAHVARARALRRFLVRELHPLALAEQLENRSPDGGAVEEVLHTALVADEAEPFVDQQSCNRAVGHDCSFAEETSPKAGPNCVCELIPVPV